MVSEFCRPLKSFLEIQADNKDTCRNQNEQKESKHRIPPEPARGQSLRMRMNAGNGKEHGYACGVACRSGTCDTTLAASIAERMQSGTPIP